MSPYRQFIFKSYTFEATTKTLTCTYGYDEALTFTEIFTFNFEFVPYDEAALDRAVQNLFFMAGVSYYKAFLAPHIIVKAGSIDAELAQFLSKTYQQGLGEFFYVNQLDPTTAITFPATTDKTLNMLSVGGAGKLVGLGGGKDSLVTIELLREQGDVATWNLGHHMQLSQLIDTVGLPHYQIERKWDPQLIELNKTGAYNGHVPISAILACVGVVAAVLSGRQDVVVSNENSANEPTLQYRGVAINHQYSKSLEFERDFQAILAQQFGDTIRYYSLLRPLSELRISELFARRGFSTYRSAFSSCNRAFTHDSTGLSWCGECPKCAFVFLALTPFVAQSDLEELFGKNLLQDSALVPLYKQLLGIQGDKPLECVGEIKESRAAMRLAFDHYPELRNVYVFDLPDTYDFRTLAPHSIPSEIYDTIKAEF